MFSEALKITGVVTLSRSSVKSLHQSLLAMSSTSRELVAMVHGINILWRAYSLLPVRFSELLNLKQFTGHSKSPYNFIPVLLYMMGRLF